MLMGLAGGWHSHRRQRLRGRHPRAVPLHAVVPHTAMYSVTFAHDQNGGVAQHRVSTREYP